MPSLRHRLQTGEIFFLEVVEIVFESFLRLVQLDRVEQPVRVCEGPGVGGHVRGACARLAAAGRHGLPRAIVDHGAAEVGVDDDGLRLEVVADVAPAVGRLEVRRGGAPAIRVGRPAGQVRGHGGPGPRPDAEAIVLQVGSVHAAPCGVQGVAV